MPHSPLRGSGCACGGNCLRCSNGPPIQTKLLVSGPQDALEQEADLAAADAMRASDPDVDSTPSKRRPPLIQRRVSAGNTEAGVAPPGVQTVLASTGRPLDARTRAFFETRFGHDFGDVRVHTDRGAAQSAALLGAQAYTAGHHIVFASGRFAQASSVGRRLIAHELAHTVQQGDASGGHQANHGLLQRKPDDAQSMIDQHQTLFGTQLDEVGLGNELRRRVLESDTNIDLALGVFDALSPGNRDEVAYHFMRPLDDLALMQLAESEHGRTLLARLESEMTGGFEWPEEKAEVERIGKTLVAVATPLDLSSVDLAATHSPEATEAERRASPFGTSAPSPASEAFPFPTEDVGDYEFASAMGKDLWARLQVVWAWIGQSRFGAVQLLVQFLETLNEMGSVVRRAAPDNMVLDGLVEEVEFTLDLLWELDAEDSFLGERFATMGGYLRDLDVVFYTAEEGARGEEDAGRLQLILQGFGEGVASLDPSQVSRFSERLDAIFIHNHPFLGRVYFQGGMLWGVVEEAGKILEVIFDLMTPEGAAPHEQALWEAVAALNDLAEEMLGPNAGQVAHDIGYALGAQIPEEIVELNKISSDLDFASALGKKIGPIVVGIILSLLGFWTVFTERVVAAAKMIGEKALDAFASLKKLKNLLPGRAPSPHLADEATAAAPGVVPAVEAATTRPQMTVNEIVSLMRDYKARGRPILFHRTRQQNVAANDVIRPETIPAQKTNPGTEEMIFFMEGKWKMTSNDYGRYFVFLEDSDIDDFNLQPFRSAKEEWVTYSSLPADRGRWALHEDVLKALEIWERYK